MTRTTRRGKRLTDKQEAKIQKRIASDPDAPEATDAQLAKAKPFAEAMPDLMESIKRGRGRPLAAETKHPVTIRLDRNVVEKFKATGKGWQSRINEILKQAKL